MVNRREKYGKNNSWNIPNLFISIGTIGMIIPTADNFGRTSDTPHSTSRGR
jgi:hypothetical protein